MRCLRKFVSRSFGKNFVRVSTDADVTFTYIFMRVFDLEDFLPLALLLQQPVHLIQFGFVYIQVVQVRSVTSFNWPLMSTVMAV